MVYNQKNAMQWPIGSCIVLYGSPSLELLKSLASAGASASRYI